MGVMDTRDLISLVVDYEVPPSIIIEAISDGRLTPIVTEPGQPTLETVAFPQHQVQNLFWAYALKHKDYELRAELARRIHFYHGIVSGIIGAVAGVGATAALTYGSGTVSEGAAGGHGPEDFRSELPMPDFAIPLAPPHDRFTLASWHHRLTVRHPESFVLTASADGTAVNNCGMEGHVTIRHSNRFEAHYSGGDDKCRALVPRGTKVAQGDPVVEIVAVTGRLATGYFTLFRMCSTGAFEPLQLDLLGWPSLPAAQA